MSSSGTEKRFLVTRKLTDEMKKSMMVDTRYLDVKMSVNAIFINALLKVNVNN